MDQLHAPWRMDYIRSLDKPPADECFLCTGAAAAPADFKKLLVLWTTPHTLVCINKFPYTNGHLLVAPRAHKAEFELLDADELTDLQRQTVEAIGLLKRAISPQGFNVGVNLGRCARARDCRVICISTWCRAGTAIRISSRWSGKCGSCRRR